MTEKTSTPEDSIRNLRLVIEVLQELGLPGYAGLAEDGIWQIERLNSDLAEADKTIETFGDVSPQQYQKEIKRLRAQIKFLKGRVRNAHTLLEHGEVDKAIQLLAETWLMPFTSGDDK